MTEHNSEHLLVILKHYMMTLNLLHRPDRSSHTAGMNLVLKSDLLNLDKRFPKDRQKNLGHKGAVCTEAFTFCEQVFS
jgi:hypothetical protein